MGASGSPWELLGRSGSFWEPLEAFGSLWEPLEASGSLWELLGASGRFWELLKASGSSWALVGGSRVDLGAQTVPKCGSEIADSSTVWHSGGPAAEFAKQFCKIEILEVIRVR